MEGTTQPEDSNGLVLLVELWRSDLVTSVVELDSEGNVMNTAEQQVALGEMYPPGGSTIIMYTLTATEQAS
jgi:hypothetical protein